MIREFNADNVMELWHAFAASIRDTKGGISVLMEAILPVVSDLTITIGFNSELQKTKFGEVMIPLKNYLHKHFGFNPHVVIEVAQSTQNTAKYYTPKDKLERLMELNPALRRFQKELGLDLDYD